MKITDIKIKGVSDIITSENYENIFDIYNDENGFYYYNLLKKVDFPLDLDASVFDYYLTKPIDTYPNISYNFYGSVVLWWIIVAANNIDNPMEQPKAGTLLKIIKPIYVSSVLSRLTEND